MELKEGESEETLECNSMGLFGWMEHQSKVTPNTLRVRGTIKGIPVEILVDSGASHSFVSPQVAAALELAVEPYKNLGVRLGDGHRILTQGECKGVELELGKYKTTVDTLRA